MSVPKLRFSGFDGPWKKCKLSDMASYTKGFAFKSQNYASEGERIIRVSDLLTDSIRDQSEKIYIDQSNLKGLEKYQINKGEIIVTTVGSKPDLKDSAVGRAILVRDEKVGYLNQNLLKLETNSQASNEFVYMSISGARYLSYIKNIQRGNANQSNITVGNLMEFPIFSPDLSEQKKVGLFLSKIDQKIALLTKNHELLIQYKRGVMQLLFNQEIRFKEKDGRDFPRWHMCTLNERVSSIGSGGTPKSTTATYYNGGIPWVSIADMTEQGKYISKTKKTLSNEGLKNSSAKLFPAGTVLYAMYASLGECSLAGIGVSTSQAILGIQTKPSELNNEYLYHWLCSIKDRVILMGQQGTQSNLNLEIVKKFEMNLPSLSEQLSIKRFLNALDENIQISSKRIELIKQFKLGLLQLMFV